MDKIGRFKILIRFLIGNGYISSQKDLGVKLGYQNESSFSQVLNGKVRQPKDFISRLQLIIPELNKEWIEHGTGEMLSGGTSVAVASSSTRVPLINIDSVGGIHSENAITASEQYVIRELAFDGAREGDVAILQSGNSMSPTIPSGAVLLIREVVDWREYFGYGNVYVLLLKDGRRITKEVRRYEPDPTNYITCASYNPEVAPEELPRAYILRVWKVVKCLIEFGW